jgi:hypothetical protein
MTEHDGYDPDLIERIAIIIDPHAFRAPARADEPRRARAREKARKAMDEQLQELLAASANNDAFRQIIERFMSKKPPPPEKPENADSRNR